MKRNVSPFTRRQTHTGPPVRPPSTGDDRNGFRIALLVVLLCGAAYWLGSTSDERKERRQSDDQSIIDEDTKPNPNPKPDDDTKPEPAPSFDLKESYLVKVFETEADQTPPWMINFLDNMPLRKFVKENMKGMTEIDPGSDPEAAASFLKAAEKRGGIKPPFLFHGIDGNPITIIPMSEDLTAEKYIERLKQGK